MHSDLFLSLAISDQVKQIERYSDYEIKEFCSVLKDCRISTQEKLIETLRPQAHCDITVSYLSARLEERKPNDWNLSVFCPVLNKGDPTIYVYYKSISLLPVTYKVLTGVLYERLNPIVKTLIESSSLSKQLQT